MWPDASFRSLKHTFQLALNVDFGHHVHAVTLIDRVILSTVIVNFMECAKKFGKVFEILQTA